MADSQTVVTQSVDPKKTVNLPKTGFGMKANLAQMEPKLLERWAAEDLYGQIRAASKGRPQYVLHDGPPYANGNIHLGHAFNKTLKDFVVKTKTMMGFDSPYTPGWDCHGLPIEIKVDGELGSKKRSMSPVEIRQACRKYAQKYVDLQKKDFIRLGVFGDWAHPYLTMEAGYQAVIAKSFVDFFEKGYVYKGLKPVNWCMNDRTALAEAEVEYENHTSPSVWVRFALTSDAAAIDPGLAGKRVYGLIWTTTPWTLPANLAIAFHPKFEYAAVDVAGDVYIVAEGLREATATNIGWSVVGADAAPVIARFEGKRLDGTVFRHPFIERDSKGILGDHVTLEAGTGAVHTAPGHGNDDYVVGSLQYGLPVYCPVDAGGRLYEPEGTGVAGQIPAELLGKTVWEANPIVIGILESRGALLAQKKIEHSYPHCWRCHKPTIFRGTDQWFIAMDHENLRQRALEAISKVKWIPAWGEERIKHMVETRPDWCISRQRLWGVPIIAFHCAHCNEMLRDRKALDHVVALFAEHTADVWYARDAAGLLPEGVKCEKCGESRFERENDILDVWFDSGASHMAVLGNDKFNLPWPADLYLEGGDQYRGWFMSSLLEGVALKGSAPYRESATPGWTLDGEGRALSKSRGEEAVEKSFNKFGADVLRLWVSSVEFTEDVRISDTILERLTEAYRKLRNTIRYGLGNLSDFDPAKDAVAADQLREIDQWMLVRCAKLADRCRDHYEKFEFHRAYQALYNFATVDLSSLYFDVIKDVLYTSAPNGPARRSAQTALYSVTHAFLRLAAPILTFTAEEAWAHLKKQASDPQSIHLASFPTSGELVGPDWVSYTRGTADNWEKLVEVREAVAKTLEAARQEKLIGGNLEAKLLLRASGDQLALLRQYADELPALFITSQVELSEGDFAAEVRRADGTKCDRCWKYTTDVGSNAALPTLCANCAKAVDEGLASGAWGELKA